MFVLKTIFSLIFCLFPVWGTAQDALPGKAKTDAVAIPLSNDSVSQHAVFDGRKYAADYPNAELVPELELTLENLSDVTREISSLQQGLRHNNLLKFDAILVENIRKIL